MRTEVCHTSRLIPLRPSRKRTLRVPGVAAALSVHGPGISVTPLEKRLLLTVVAAATLPSILFFPSVTKAECPEAYRWKTQSAEAKEELQDPGDDVRMPFNKEIKDRISGQHKPFPSGHVTPKFMDA